jgi:hypothetical protein
MSDWSRVRLTSSIIEELFDNMNSQCTEPSGNCVPKGSLSRPGCENEKKKIKDREDVVLYEKNIRLPQISNEEASFFHHRNALFLINHFPVPGY